MKNLIAISALFLVGCSPYPETPEEVVEAFSEALSSGDCETAEDYCTGEAAASIQMSIDAGCEPYETTIDSVYCEEVGIFANCVCNETREFGQLQFPYELMKSNGKWKIRSYTKDIGMEE